MGSDFDKMTPKEQYDYCIKKSVELSMNEQYKEAYMWLLTASSDRYKEFFPKQQSMSSPNPQHDYRENEIGTPMITWYKKDGTPISDHEEISKLLNTPSYQRIRETTLPDGKYVSTVWVGVDYGFGGKPPLIFETMVFQSKKKLSEIDMERYSTEEEAIEGHERMVKKYSKEQASQAKEL